MKTLRIRRPDQIAALASPARQEIVDVLQAAGPAPVARIAAALGREVSSLYYHLRALHRVGLVCKRAARGRREIWSLPAQRVLIAAPVRGRAVTDVVGSLLRVTGRDAAAALRDRRTITAGAHRELRAQRVTGRLTGVELATVNRLLDRARAVFVASQPRTGGRLRALTIVVAPAGPRTRANKKPRIRGARASSRRAA